MATWLGLSTATLAFLYGIWTILKVLLWGDPVRGYLDIVAGAAGAAARLLSRDLDRTHGRPLSRAAE